MTLQFQFDDAVKLQQEGRFADAEQLCSQIIGAEPDNFAARRMVAVLRYQQQRFIEALSALDAAIALKPETAELWVLRGVTLHALGRPEEAVTSMTKATALEPRDIQAWYNRGHMLNGLGRFQESVESYDKALAIAPGADALANRAGALIHLKRAAEALESCDKALALRPDHLPALCNRALALAELKRYVDAVAAFDRVLAAAPNMAEAWNNRGTVLRQIHLFDEAFASFDRATALHPGSMAAWCNRGASLAALQRYDEARASFEKALAVAAPRNATEWDIAGDALMGLKRYEDAAGAYEKALAIAPEAAGIWSKHAEAFYMLARFDEALESSARALALRPDLSEALEIRGRVLLEMNRIEEGLTSLAQSGKDRPTDLGQVPEHKARHDAEQREYLAAQGVVVEAGKPYIAGGARIAGPAVNPANADAVAKAWAGASPQIVVIDNLLTPEGLEALRRFCWGSTIWQRPYDNGYLGAMPEMGFAAPLIAQIAEELRTVFPTVIGDHGLRLLWGFKYDSRLTGINIHADQAAVNVNFWLTPDEANLDPERGGLVVYDANAPADWQAAEYNGKDPRVWEFLKRVGAKPVSVPYRANRAVIFDSDLFHETDVLTFKEGYLNRRINVTMLFGRRTFYGT